jgi:hypothetical protein
VERAEPLGVGSALCGACFGAVTRGPRRMLGAALYIFGVRLAPALAFDSAISLARS